MFPRCTGADHHVHNRHAVPSDRDHTGRRDRALRAGARSLATHRALDEFLAALEEGGVVLDAREAIERNFGLVLRSPYVNPYLEPGIITNAHGLPRDALDAVARGFWGSDAEVMMDTSPAFSFTGFDTVALDLYVAFWKAGGARVARRTNVALVWEE